jgi:hypothetical protein
VRRAGLGLGAAIRLALRIHVVILGAKDENGVHDHD